MLTVPPATLAASLRDQHLLFLGDSVMAQLECDLRFALDSVSECWSRPHPACDTERGQCAGEFVYPRLNISTRFLGVGCPWFCDQHNNGSVTERRALVLPQAAAGATSVVFNIGNHYAGMKEGFFTESVAQFELGLRRTRLPVAVISPSATHFATADGSYHGTTASSGGHCQAHAAGALPTHPQEHHLRHLAARLPQGRYVDIYRLSDDPRQHSRWHTSADGKLHVVDDCRHFCQNCFMLRAWNTLLAQELYHGSPLE